MKLLFENWRKYLSETSPVAQQMKDRIAKHQGKEPSRAKSGEEIAKELGYEVKNKINTRDEIIDFIKNNPDQNINIDSPKGSIKGFGGADEKLPFDYGEWPHLNNPADNMGWDLIIVPSATKEDLNLIPVGYVEYDPELKPKKIGNDKIIIAPEGNYLQSDKKIIDDFFSSVEHIKKPTWLQGDKDENHERAT